MVRLLTTVMNQLHALAMGQGLCLPKKLWTTAVTVNEVSAPFHVLNNSTILFTVPPGAVSGPIEVTNAGGETTNSQNFIVDF